MVKDIFMCGLKASDVREKLVSAAVREAEQDFVYGEIKPQASEAFFAASVSFGWGLLAGSEALWPRECSAAWRG